jgi:hypothetical protein
MLLAMGLVSYLGAAEVQKTQKAPDSAPQSTESLENDDNAVQAAMEKKRAAFKPKGVQMIVKGRIHNDSLPMTMNTQLVITMETGDTYVLGNGPYVNTLRLKAMGKMVKLKGIDVGETSFKKYHGLYVQDILEIVK